MENLNFAELNLQELEKVNGGFGAFIAGIIIGVLIGEMLDKNAHSDFEAGRQAFRDWYE